MFKSDRLCRRRVLQASRQKLWPLTMVPYGKPVVYRIIVFTVHTRSNEACFAANYMHIAASVSELLLHSNPDLMNSELGTRTYLHYNLNQPCL